MDLIELKIEGPANNIQNTSPQGYKTQTKFNLILGKPNRTTGGPLLGRPKSIYKGFNDDDNIVWALEYLY